ncbi:hypothetical protein C8A05DRAFT_42807 [Staphylotrichum tortipilum]|uniref:DUF2415 domain-containing protein n=1 Tax=Staphylotrichum tortipilum TaxID=2831512 RepID=A0AAN6RVB0_9PEZI|nr:hypothetical protein C8A05DRAFT_42807 [Staphylotrichum longicolle]
MAIGNSLYTPTEDLILPTHRHRFRTGVHWQHWQLRSLIGTDPQNHIYFPVAGPDSKSYHVQRLNTKTRETETVKRLSFNPRCLVARNGWVCCGGELGVFSTFRVGERTTVPDENATRLDFQVDGRLPLSMDLTEDVLTSLAAAHYEKSLVAQSIGFGKARVNCITIWSPPIFGDPVDGAYDQDVAVLAHNDSSVIVVSLRDQEALDKVTYPEYMNRGVISPDGGLLVAISDDPYLHIHERREKKSEMGTSARIGDRPAYEWGLCGKLKLKSQSKDDRSDNRGSFAATFSSTGKYLAVGTQYGTISIFNAAALAMAGVNPLITSFDTSRPNAEFGAVRDMAFSPGPIDLLAWTEDRGRVGIADIRTGFESRQILYLDKEDQFEHLAVTDRGTIDPRLLEQRVDRGDSLLSSFASALESSSERRQNRLRQPEGPTPLSRYNIPLTADETAVLEAMQDYRRRNDPYNATSGRIAPETGSSSNGNSNGNGANAPARPPWAERATREALRTREQAATVSQAVNSILGSLPEQRLHSRDIQERLRAREESAAERRRYAAPSPPSVGPNPMMTPTAAAAGGGAGGASGSGSGSGSLVSRLLASASSTSAPGGAGAGAGLGWDIVETLVAYLMREWEETPGGRQLGTFLAPTHARPGPHDTAGLAWGEDGGVLFVGAENGIYEFHVNLFGRKVAPSITLS